ncbi:hypothetical protein BBP40_005861 [Aspergillus hancockii]|nr:hypothetical protein BBP40_005861 [Aspergillus hancockii]
MRMLAQARDMFEGTKLAGRADEVSHLDQVAEIKHTVSTVQQSNHTTTQSINTVVEDGSGFFLSSRLPLSEFSLGEPTIEDIIMFSGG